MNFKNLIKSNYQFLLIIFVIIILTIRDLPSYGIIHKWVATLWAFSYKDGFIARGFMGSIARLFFSCFILLQSLYCFHNINSYIHYRNDYF
jgi:hypothetical protein